MKKLMLLVSLFMVAMTATAQELDMMEVIPNDPEVRAGVLDNGARYYIRKNTKDPQRTNFHILYNVGAILEEDRQDGLAHFLEHMAFNGSKNFEGNGLIEYCQSNGIEFGANLNAGTGQEVTTYMITNVPTVREGIIDSMLLVLHDWAGFISLNEKDIDEERGVISEEWRMYEAMADQRMSRKSTALIYGEDNIYSKRDIIGPLENIQGFEYQDIKDFYEKWYRPDLQAFIIVGDIDPEVIEAKLKAVMADVKPHENPAPKPKFTLEKHEEPRFGVFTDPEASEPSITLICKLKPFNDKYKNTLMYEKTELLNGFATQMINERFSELAKQSGAKFQRAYTYTYDMSELMDVFAMSATARQGESVEAFEAAFTEVLRAVRGGYAEPELDRIKADYLTWMETNYNNRNDRKNQQFVNEYNSNFYDNTAYPTAEYQYEMGTKLIESITLQEVNAQVQSLLTEDNVVVYITEKSGDSIVNATTEELAAAYAKVMASEIEPYTEEVITRPLIADLSALKGSPVKKSEEGKFGSTVWTLKNGIKVVVNPTDYKADEVILSAVRKGGTSKIEDLQTLYSINLKGSFASVSGVSDFTATELNRVLAGKNAYVYTSLGRISEGFGGGSSVKDIETMFQLLYLNVTAPRFEQADWDVMMDKLHTQVKGELHDPMRIFRDSMAMTASGNDLRQLPMGEEYLSKVSFEAMIKEYKKIYGNVSNMTFFITGSVELDSLKPLVEKYIGSLPAPKAKKATYGEYMTQTPKGEVVNRYSVPQESPNVIAVVLYSGDLEYSQEEAMNLEVAGGILDNLYTRTIREENSGVYVVQNQMTIADLPEAKYSNFTIYMTDTSKVFELLPLVQQGVDTLVMEGPTDEQLQKVRLAMEKNFIDNNRTNRQWQNYLQEWYMWGEDEYTNYDAILKGITKESVQEAARRAFGQGNRIELIQLP